MNYIPECGDAEVHMFHEFIDGDFKVLWCSGLCDCGGRGGPHGPGEHK